MRRSGTLPRRRHRFEFAVALTMLFCLRTGIAWPFGQLPLVSEDPTSPCASTLDSSVAYGLDLLGPGRDQLGEQEFRSHLDMSVPLVQLNYGLTDRIQTRVEGEIPLTTVAPNNGGLSVGFGDLSAGIKYRFMDQVDGLEYADTCDPPQYEASNGLQGPVSISVFPQFSFPTGGMNQGLGSGDYSAEFPVDVARKFGALYLVGEFSFLWRYHDRSQPNELALGIAAYYSITPKLDLLGEQRVIFQTSGLGTTLWLMNLGAQYEINDNFAIFFAAGTSAAASSTVAQSNFSTIVGTDITLPMPW